MKTKVKSKRAKGKGRARAAKADPRGAGADLRLERGADGLLWVHQRGESRPVRVRTLFPWSREGAHVSLRDKENHEVALVVDPVELDRGSRAALDEALGSADFVLEVTRVQDIEEEVEIRVWRVETLQGSRTFQTRLDDWPRQLPGGGLLIRDVAGDLYHVPRPEALDEESRKELWAFVD